MKHPKFPKKLYTHEGEGVVYVSTSADPDAELDVIAEITGDDKIAFIVELCRRWNRPQRIKLKRTKP